MKKIISVLLTVSCLLGVLSPVAFAREIGKEYTYIFEDGTSTYYYLDDVGMPYQIINGEQVYIALALDHLEVLDNDIIESLDSRASNEYDISDCEPDEDSPKYTVTATGLANGFFKTQTLIYNRHHTGIAIKTSKHSPTTASNKISFIYYFYKESDRKWFSLSFTQKNCSVFEYRFQHSPSVYPKGYFSITAGVDLSSCNVTIYTGPFIPSSGVPIY